jgi:hypothetical protein
MQWIPKQGRRDRALRAMRIDRGPRGEVLVSRALAALLALVLVADVRLLGTLFRAPVGSPVWGMLAIHVALLIGAVIGLSRLRPWGYHCVYVLVPFSTLLLSISLIPHLPRPFPPEVRPYVLVAANLAVLAAAVFAHVGYRRSARRDTSASKPLRDEVR